MPSLLKYNTFGIEANADELMEYDSVDQLRSILPLLKGKRVLHIGSGSNLLFTDDFHGVILHSRIKGIEMTQETNEIVFLRVGAAVVWDDLVAFTVKHGWSGLENLSLIPGEVGAAAVQNIGAYGAEAKDVIVNVEAVKLDDGSIHSFSNDACHYAYRQSVFKNELKGQFAITYVNFRLHKQFIPNLGYGNINAALQGKDLTPQAVRQTIIDTRNAKLPDPKVMGNAGSFFMNPVVSREKFEQLQQRYPNMPFYEVPTGVKIPAGWLIEQAGWKGRALGNAAVHDKQALVIVNLGGATAEEIVNLSDTVRKAVSDQFGIDIHPEVNFI